LVQMRLGGADVVATSCVVHKLTSKIMVTPAIQKVADLRGKVLAVANPGSASDFAAKRFLARQGMKPGQDISLIYSGSTSAAFAALVNGRVQAIFATSPNDLQAAQAGFKPLLELRLEHSLCRKLQRGDASLHDQAAGAHAQLCRRHHRGDCLHPTAPQRSQGNFAEVYPGFRSKYFATRL